MDAAQECTPQELIAAAKALPAAGMRMLGITGAPGAGKTTIAEAITAAVSGSVLVGMDGFHLAEALVIARGIRDRKGAPHTFDVHGFVAILDRIRAQLPDSPTVYAPRFDRGLDDAICSAVEVPAAAPLVIIEGNYLLHDRDGWELVRPALDAVWFLDPPERLRHERLISRHTQFGLDRDHAREWALGTDEHNAVLVRAGRARADRIVSVVSGVSFGDDTRTEAEVP
ncbi:Pantothenate kinase [Microbacterium esteraromaticum]|uniref:Pantothenate kinase n=1 Tax=Microbacterium esteraromaticum TaxID=57043 RepID=A0A1R4K6F5_9MICO|nr:nucleoside/nucleotide kinase family protein [Microbacterium esteraromaticum]SJN40011.1 Pantothenate kinase [Microbacterium esteraromaticum]